MNNTQLVTKSLIEIESANFELISIVIGKEVFFPAIDIAKRMEYVNAKKAVNENISDQYKLSYRDIVNKINECSKVDPLRGPLTEAALIEGMKNFLQL